MSTDYQAMARADAQAAGIDPNVFVKQIQQESGFNPNAISPAGAIGIAQFMPRTAASMGINPYDPVSSLRAAAQLDASNIQKYGGDYSKALAAYNAGGGAVDSAVSKGGNNWLSLMPLETQNYIKAILGSGSSLATATKDTGVTPGSVTNSSSWLGSVQVWGEYIAVFLIATVLIIMGFFLIAGKQATKLVKGVMP